MNNDVFKKNVAERTCKHHYASILCQGSDIAYEIIAILMTIFNMIT